MDTYETAKDLEKKYIETMLSAYNKDDMVRLMSVLGLSEISKIKNLLDILNLLNLKERSL